MAKFQDSRRHEHGVSPSTMPTIVESKGPPIHDRLIGDIIRELRNLSADEVERVLSYQREHGGRFGDAAVALGLASSDDVLFALSQQFHYPYAPEEQRNVSSELVALHQPFSYQAESFRGIRSQLMMRLFSGDQPRHSLAVVSPEHGDGKTFFAANLAVMLAQLGGRTLLVDADLRNPRLHSVFGLQNAVGLSGVLAGRAEPQVIQQVMTIPSLFVMTVGVTPPNPLELIERPAFALLMRELTSKFDHVLVDTPAAVYGSDGAVIASKCGAALVVARKNESKMDYLEELVEVLKEGGAKIAGVVVNDY